MKVLYFKNVTKVCAFNSNIFNLNQNFENIDEQLCDPFIKEKRMMKKKLKNFFRHVNEIFRHYKSYESDLNSKIKDKKHINWAISS